jgi:metal-responsive CopG/Arc/MetJ family transcriptional regulator
MNKAKVAISMKRETLNRLDRLVRKRVFPSRSEAIGKAVEEKLEKIEKNRLKRECMKLDPAEEKSMANEGLVEDSKEWPEY